MTRPEPEEDHDSDGTLAHSTTAGASRPDLLVGDTFGLAEDDAKTLLATHNADERSRDDTERERHRMVEPPAPMVITGPGVENAGPLTCKILEYDRIMRQLVAAAKEPDDWAALAEFVAVDEFERVGTFLEVQNWQQYTEMLIRWASPTAKFETSVRRITEVPSLVYYEIEERHFRGDDAHVVNTLTVFEFNEAGKIRHLDVFLQQER